MKQIARFSVFFLFVVVLLFGSAISTSGAAKAEEQPIPLPIVATGGDNPPPTAEPDTTVIPTPVEPGEGAVPSDPGTQGDGSTPLLIGPGIDPEESINPLPIEPVSGGPDGVFPVGEGILNISAQYLIDGENMIVTWETGQPTEGWVLFGSQPFLLDKQLPEEGGLAGSMTHHSVTIPMPHAGIPLYFAIVVDGVRYNDNGWPFKIYAGDEGGNFAAQPAGQQTSPIEEVGETELVLASADKIKFERTLSRAIDQTLESIAEKEIELMSDIPLTPDVRLLTTSFDGHVITTNFSEELGEWDETARAELVHQIDLAADAAFLAAGLQRPSWTEYHILVEGVPMNEPQAVTESEHRTSSTGGKRIVLNPGHGHYDSGGGWPFQRGYFWGIVEDKVNLDFMIKLRDSLNGTGADLRPTRQLNKSAGNHHSGYPWWEMDASEYIRSLGAPESVWRPFGMSGINRDIRSRPEYAKWIDADVIVSIHNNGGRGTGTETWYDYSNGYQSESRRLAVLMQNKIVQRIKAEWDPQWESRGAKGSDEYGENRWFDGPAVIVEVGFMDTQKDNEAIRDPRFQAIVAAAMREAIVEFYGGIGDNDDNRTIRHDQTLYGTIDPPTDTDIYYFEGRQGQQATIRMNKRDGSTLDSYLYLYAPNGQHIATNDDGGGYPNAKIVKTLPQDGRYQIVGKSYANRSAGTYSLQLQLSTNTCPNGQYLAEYFNNTTLSGSPTFTRCESQIDHDWGNGGPGNGVGNDNFSVRWTGRFNFNSATYKFTGRADDGIRVYVDGQRIIDGWRDQPPTTYQATHNVSGGTHEVKVFYYEHGGGAYVKFGWQQDPSCSSYRAEYYNNRYLSGSPVLVRCEGSILKDWRSGSPGSGVGSDNFSARWTGRFNFTGGDYTFIAQADDGIRVWLDGILIINAWRDQPPTTYTKTRYVSAGTHSVKVEYYENGGGAVAKVWWESTRQCSNQYKAEYWNNRSLSGSPVLTRCEGWPINHNWGDGGPGGAVPPNDFSARWTGQASFSQGTYRFVARADDGVRVWLDGRLIIDGWRDQAPTTYTRTRDVSSGTHTVKVEYYEHGGGAVAQFYWERVQAGGSNLARGRTARATSYESSSYTPAKGNDGSNSTRWSSRISSTLGGQRWYVDLGSRQSFNKVRINWETAYAAYYRVVWSDDGQTWWYRPNSTEYTRSSPGWAEHTFSTVSARYVGVSMYTRAPRMNNYSFFEFEAYGSSGQNILEQQSESELQEDILPEEGN